MKEDPTPANGSPRPISAEELQRQYTALQTQMIALQRELEKTRSVSVNALVQNVLAVRIANLRDKTNRISNDRQAAARIILTEWTKSGIEKLGVGQLIELLKGTGVDQMLGTSEDNKMEYRRIIGELLGQSGLGLPCHRRGRNGNERYYALTSEVLEQHATASRIDPVSGEFHE